jgi:hypothetical protein
MEHGWSLYFLSIVDNARVAAGLVIAASVTAAFLCFMMSFASFEKATNERGREIAKPFVKPIAASFFIAMLFLVLFPTRRDVIESYLMLEGQEIVNAKNAEKVGERVDKLLDAIEHKFLGNVVGDKADGK